MPVAVVICFLTVNLLQGTHVRKALGSSGVKSPFVNVYFCGQGNLEMIHFNNKILVEETQFQRSKVNCYRSPTQLLIGSRLEQMSSEMTVQAFFSLCHT